MSLTEIRTKDAAKLIADIKLDDATISLDEENGVVIGGPDWGLVSKRIVPPYGYDFLVEGKSIDARILLSNEYTYGKFRSPDQTEYSDIRKYGNNKNTLKKVVAISHRLFHAEETIDILALLDAGEFSVAPRQGAVIDIRKGREAKSQKSEITSVIFDHKNLLFCVDLKMMKAFKDLGCELLAPIDGESPVICIKWPLFEAVGFLNANLRTGIRRTKDNRKISADAIEVAWVSEDEALRALDLELEDFRPRGWRGVVHYHDLDKLVTDSWYRLAKPVSALRWHGYPDHQINKILKQREYDAWFQIHRQILTRAKEKLDQLMSETASVPYIESQAKQLCDEIESLQKAMRDKGNPEVLDLGIIPELINKLKEMRYEI